MPLFRNPLSPEETAFQAEVVGHIKQKKDAEREKYLAEEAARPFRFLIRPLSGVSRMAMFTNGDQKILLIGEEHTTEFCKEKGYTPIAQIIEEYLASVDNVDFMIEISNKSSLLEEPEFVEETKRIVNSETNQPPTGENEPRQILSLTETILRPYLPPNRKAPSRVHWLDAEIVDPSIRPQEGVAYHESTRPRFANELIYHFQIYADYYGKNVNYNDDSIDQTVIDQTLSDYQANIDRALMHFGYMVDWAKNWKSNKWSFFDACYEALRYSKFFRKCYGDDSRTQPFPLQLLREAFKASWIAERQKSLDLLYFNVQRFFMDMYTCCRIIKKDPQWFKNIVIYAGEWHVANYIYILYHSGYTRHILPVPIKYNPRCADYSAGTRRKKKKAFSKKRR